MKSAALTALLLLGAGQAQAQAQAQAQEPAPFFDGTDEQTGALIQQAEQRIEQVRKGNLSIRLVDADGNAVTAPAVVELAAHDFRFGTNLYGLETLEDQDPLKQTALQAIRDVFNSVIVCDYWRDTEPQRGAELDWSLPDYGNRMAEELGKNPRHHALLYGFPNWLHTYDSEEAMWEVIEQRIKSIADHYGDKINEIDVINEFISYHHWRKVPLAAYVRSTHFPDMAKPENGARALRIARKYLPQAKLVVLETGLWNLQHPVFPQIVDYHRKLIELGADYDYIGYQAHFYSRGNRPFHRGHWKFGPRTFMMDGINDAIEAVIALGKPVVITELNAPSRDKLRGDNQPRISDAEIAAWETNFYTLMFSKPAIKGVSRWFTIDSLGGRAMDGGIISEDGQLKPNYYALKKLIKEKWHTRWSGEAQDGQANFRGFYGTYNVMVDGYQSTEVKLTAEQTEATVMLAQQ